MSTTNFKNSVVVTATDPRGKTVSVAGMMQIITGEATDNG